MKKALSLFLAALLLIGICPVFAETTPEEALLLAKIRTTVPEELTEFSYETHTEYGETYYSLNWETPADAEKSGSLNVQVCGDVIIRYNNYIGYKEPSAGLSSFTEEEILAKAKEWMAKLNPGIADLYTITVSGTPDPVSSTVSLRLVRYANGIPFPANSGYMSLDKKTGELTNFWIDYWANTELPSPDGIMTQEEATAYFKENYGLVPQYRIEYDNKERTAKIVYQPDWDGMMDAATGSDVITEDAALYATEAAMADMSAGGSSRAMQNAKAMLSVAELSALEKQENLLSKDEIIAIVEKDPYFSTEGLTLTSSSLQADYYDDDSFYYNLHYNSEDKETYRYLSVTVDAATGAIQSFRSYRDGDSNDKLIAKADAEKRAQEVMDYYLGDRAKEYRLLESDEEHTVNPITAKADEAAGYSVRYQRYANDIAVEGDYANVSVTAEGVNSFYADYTNIDLPAPEILSEEDALTRLFEQTDLALCYEITNYEKRTATLIYHFENHIEMDAKTGDLPADDSENLPYTDMEGHWSAEYVEALRLNGIRPEGNEFRPDEAITNGDYLTMLSYAMGITYLSDADEIIARLRRNGIVEENVDPDEALTRSNAVKYLIHAAGGKEFAKIEGIYTQPFTDVSEDIGYIALAYGMGIISGEADSTFRPKETMTRAEAATVLYRYLTK